MFHPQARNRKQRLFRFCGREFRQANRTHGGTAIQDATRRATLPLHRYRIFRKLPRMRRTRCACPASGDAVFSQTSTQKKDAGLNQRPPALKEDFALTISAEQSPLVKTLHFYTDLASLENPSPRTRKHKVSSPRRSNGLPAVTGLPGRPSLHVNASGVPHVAPRNSPNPSDGLAPTLAWATGRWALTAFANPLSAPNQ